MTNLLPLTSIHTTVSTRLNLRTTRVQLTVLLILGGLLSAVSLSASAFSVRHLLFAKRVEAKPATGTLPASSARSRLSAPFAPTPTDHALNIARRGHSATVLRNGKILIIGGENQNGFVTEAEIFDPANGSFSLSGNLNVPRADHSATPLFDGRVLIAGGRGAMGRLNSTEIFDPVSGAFTNGQSMNQARTGHSATMLSDGRIVFTGGDDNGTIEMFDSARNIFTSLSATLATPRAFHATAILNDGRILIVGGSASDGNEVKSGEIIGVDSDIVASVINNTEDEHISPLLRVLPDGKVQIIGGSDHEVIEIYDPAINQFGAHAHVFPIGDSHPELWQQIMNGPTRAALFRLGSTNLTTNRARHTVTEFSGSKHALIAGGVDANGMNLSTVSLVDSSTATITTDKLDYAPGSPVIVSGAGFQSNEVVTLSFHEDPHVDSENPHTFTVQADANGNFSCPEYAPEDEDRGITYLLAAIGGSSGLTAQTALTDSVPPTISLSALGASACENFNTLASTGTSSTTPNGWTFAESGTGANTTYTAGTGSSTTGDTFSFGATSNPERAFGELTTGSLSSMIGSSFTNNTGQTITSLAISYTGEQWRLGALNRTDRLDFQYSTDATSLTTGTWTDVNALDFTAPVQGPTTGALDGNASANRTSVNATITGLNIAHGANFWIRWNSIDAGSSDDGLAIDDFCLTPQGTAEVSVAVSPSAVDEDGAANLVYTFTRSSTSGGALTANFSVGGSASLNADYTQSGASSFSASAGTVTFAAGQSTTTVTIDPTTDNTVESDETVILSVTSGAGYSIGLPSSANGTITNDDHELSINPTVTVTEGNSGSSNMTFTVTLSPAHTQTVTVNYSTADGTTNPALGANACGATTDYISQSGTLTFTPGQTVKTIDVSICGDTRDEPDETLTVSLDTPANATIASSQAISTGTITDDDDMPTISINDVTMNEGNSGNTAFDFTVSLSNPAQGPITVDYQTQDNSATALSDYVPITMSALTFNPDETSKTITVLVSGDTTFEANESFFVSFSNNSSNSNLSLGTKGTGTITNDDSIPTVQFASASSSGAESASPVDLQVTLSNTTYQTVTVNYAVDGGSTATGGGVDYNLTAGSLTFNPGDTAKNISFTVNDDNLTESNETVIIALNSPSNANLASTSSHTYTIQDNDSQPTIQFAVANSAGVESVSPANLMVILSAASSGTVTVNYAVTGGTATDGGSDYTLPAGSLTFNPGETTKNISLAINNDNLDEDDETVIVDLSAPVNAVLGSPFSQTYTIQDNDAAPTVQFALASSTGAESASPVNLSVNLSAPSGKIITVDYSANASSTATGGGVDYTLPAGSLTFNPGETNRNISFTVNDDNVDENDETVIVDLSAPVNADIATPSSHTYLIQDNDAAPSFSIDDVAHNEGNSGPTSYTFTVTKMGTTDLSASIDFATANSAASAGSDYTATSGTLIFAPAENNKTITVLVNGDTTYEINETFFVNLSNAANGAISDGQGLGTITNDDAEPSLSISDVTLSEGNSGTTSFSFTVTKSGTSELSSSVNYQTSDGTAFQPGDYQSKSGTLTFAASEANKQITVLVAGDNTYEGNENFTVNLSNASGATIGDDEGVGAINNDDALPSFAIDDVTMNEGTGSAATAFTFTVTRNGATELPATVDFAAANGATDPASGGAACGAGTDYAFTNGTLTFAANETTKTVTVSVCQDNDNEANETFFVNLSNPMQANIGDSQGIGTITNDDGAVSYLFQGFFAPIDRPPLINTTKAGSAVPVKWRLTVSGGAAVSDPTSFAGLFSYAAECGSSTQLETPLETTAPGESSLTYLGDGNWQINWKTLSSYQKGSCRILDLVLKDGTHHYANFKFK